MLNIFNYPAFRIFSSKDKDAPQLEQTAHSFSTVLKSCLITGYGDKSPVSGWEMPIDDVAERGVRSFCSRALHSTHSEYRVSDDNASQFTLSAYREHEDVPFATIHRSKRMWDISGKQDWIIIANEISCYVLLQTDQNKNWFAVLFFGMAYTTHQARYISVLYGGELNYLQHNYSINGMPLHDEFGNKTYRQEITHQAITSQQHHVFYPPIFINRTLDYVVFLPALVESVNQVKPPNEQAYTIVSSELYDVVFFITAWVENRFFGLAIQREQT